MHAVLRWAIVAVGTMDLLGLLSPFFSFWYKVIGIILLLVLWYQLRPASFIFGKDSRKLDILLLACFVVFSLEVFLRFGDLRYPEIMAKIFPFASALAVLGQTVLIIAVAAYAASTHLGEKSAVHSFVYLFSKKQEFWHKFSTSRKYLLFRFAVAFIVYFMIANYFFLPVLQWFVLTLDKSLILVAFLFAARKDQGMDWISRFSDSLFARLTALFTDPKYVHITLGFLLIIHYMSDISFYLIPYILHRMPADYEFYMLDPTQHQSLYSHYIAEGLTGPDTILGAWAYIFSGAGILFIVLIPVIILLLHAYKVNLKDFDWQKRFIFPLLLMMMAGSVFLMAPWVSQEPITGSEVGAYGVDFTSKPLSTVGLLFSDIFLFSVVIFMLVSLSLSRRGTEIYVLILFLCGMMYFSYYCWNYFFSSIDYYLNTYPLLANHVSSAISWAMHINRLLLPVLSALFYLGGLFTLTVFLSKYMIEGFLHQLLRKRYVIVWLIALMVTSVLLTMLMDENNFSEIMAIFLSFFAVTFVFNIALYIILRERGDYRFLMAISIVMLIFPLVSLLSLPLESYLSPDKLELAGRAVLFAAALLLVEAYHLRLSWRPRRMITAVVLGTFFGYVFAVIGEPLTNAPRGAMLLLYLLLIGLSEEILFRGLVYRLSAVRFGTLANPIQATIFTLSHFLFAKLLIEKLGHPALAVAFFVFLYVFAICAGRLAQKSMTAAVAMHFISNLVLYTGIMN